MSRRSLLRAPVAVAMILAGLSCGETITGPHGSRLSAPIAFRPQFLGTAAQGEFAEALAFSAVRIRLKRADGSDATQIEQVVSFAPTDTAVAVSMEVPLVTESAQGEPFILTLAYANAAGDTILRGGPVEVMARPRGSSGAGIPYEVPTRYTGPGASAVRVAIVPDSVEVNDLGSFALVATAYDAAGAAVPDAPIRLSTPDSSLVSVSVSGTGVARNTRGVARVIANILTGAPDTARVSVRLRPSGIVAASGNARVATVATALPSPIVVKVAASDGVGVPGVSVRFVPGIGSGLTADSIVVTNASGLASTTWVLGPLAGAQTVVATALGVAVPVTFTATATAASANTLVMSVPVATSAVVPLAPVTVEARDAFGNVDASFVRPVTMVLSSNPGAAVLGGTTTVTAVAGVATFTDLTVNRTGVGYQLLAISGDSAATLMSAPSASFSVAAGPASALAFLVPPVSATVGVAISPAVEVAAVDAAGNVGTGFTGTVAISLGSNPGGAALGGVVSAPAVSGIARFADLTLSAGGTGYTLVASSAGLTSVESPAFATGLTAVRWTNPEGGSWWNASNWDAGRVPTGSDSVFITLDGTYAVEVDSMPPVRSLVIGASGGRQTLRMRQNPANSNVLSAQRIAVGANGELLLERVNQFGAPSLELDGTLTVADLVVVNGAIVTSATSRIVVEGGASGVASANLLPQLPIVNNGTITMISPPGTGAYIGAGPGGLVNTAEGTIDVQAAGGSANIYGDFTNLGAISILGNLALLAPGHAVDNSGTVTIGAGQLNINLGNGSVPDDDGTFVSTGSIVGDSTSSVMVGGGPARFAADGSISGIGNLYFWSADAILEHDLDASFFATESRIEVLGALRGSNRYLQWSTLFGTGGFTVAPGQFATLQNSRLETTVALDGGRLTVAGTSEITGALTVASTATLSVEGNPGWFNSVLAIAEGFVNRGIINLAGTAGFNAELSVTIGSLINEVGAAIFTNGDGGVQRLTAALENRGNIFANVAFGLSSPTTVVENVGLLRATGGDITISGAGLRNVGSVQVDSARWMRVEGGTFTQTGGGIMGGGGLLSLIDAEASIDGTMGLGLVAERSGITTVVPLDLPIMNLSESTVSGAAVRVAAGRQLILTHSTLTSPLESAGQVLMSGVVALDGPITTTTTSQLEVNGGFLAGATTTVTTASGFENRGTIVLASNADFNASLTVTSGTLINALGANMLSVGAAGATFLNATVDNQGQITTYRPLRIESVAGAPSSTGGLFVRNGELEWRQGAATTGFSMAGTVLVDTAGTLTVRGGDVTVAVGTVLTGDGTLSLQSANTLMGATPTSMHMIVEGGSLTVEGTLDTRELTVVDATVSGGNIVVGVERAMAVQGASLIENAVALDGVLTLSGTPTITGVLSTTPESRIRVVGGDFGATHTSATLTSAFTNSGTLELEGIGATDAALRVTGTGGLQNAVSGTVRTLGTAGTRALTGSTIENQGTIAITPGLGGGVLAVNGFFVAGGTATLRLDVDSAGADRLSVSGAASLAGSLALAAPAGYVVPVASLFTVLEATASVTGAFGGVTVPTGFVPGVVYNATSVTVSKP